MLAPRLPPQRPRTGRPARDHRTVLSAIRWVLRTGARWHDRPERFGPRSTARNRSRRWTAAGVWVRVLATLQPAAYRAGRLDWATHFVDGVVVRARQHAAGAADVQSREALGRSRGGFSTEVHVRAEGGGKPVPLLLSGGERHESRNLNARLARGGVRRVGRGRPRVRPAQLGGGRGGTAIPAYAAPSPVGASGR